MQGCDVNPIYKEYYPHEGCDCYKIDLPWTKYNKHTLVLCKESEGYNHARTLAIGLITQHIIKVTENESNLIDNEV